MNALSPTYKRPSTLEDYDFPFEVLHKGERASNMEMYHWHDFMELSFVQSGSGIYEIEDKVYEVQEGDILIINNIERHRVTYSPENPLYETVIHFSPELIKDLSTGEYSYLKLFTYNSRTFKNKPELGQEEKQVIKACIDEISVEYQDKSVFYELMIKAKLMTIIAILIRRSKLTEVDVEERLTRCKDMERMEKILEFIDNNFQDNISLESTAQKFFMNVTYFSEYFKKNTGINFSQYLCKCRVKGAIKLMRSGLSNNTEIAFQCGFNNITSFYNAFKRMTGKSPGEYKSS